MRYEGRYPENGRSYMLAVGCEVSGDEAGREAMIADLVNFLAPAEPRQIEAWLAELSVIVARRPQEQVDEAIRLEAYASRLRAYPADVAHHAVLRTTWQFWPTWAELERVCNEHAGPRRQMLGALRRPVPARIEVARPTMTPEERAEHDRQMEEMMAELSAKAAGDRRASERRPHWTETCAPDDPRLDELRRARAANPLMNQENNHV